jgi:hypothetical protein
LPHMLGPTEVAGGGGGADPGTFAATCSAAVNVGNLVYLTGVDGPEVAICDPTDITKMPCCGAVTVKSTSTDCVVRSLGAANVWSSLVTGKVYWVGLTGQPDSAPPTGPSGSQRIAQPVGKALDSSTIQLNVAETVHKFPR